jgi:hypothetical protein
MPCLTINRIAGFLRMICNDQRAQRQAIQVDPVGSGADVKTAEIIQGYTRHVEQRSDADTTYECTFEGMARTGIHWARVLTEFADDDSLDLDLLIEEIKNSFSVYSDPGAKKADKSDMDWCFIIENVKKDEYLGEYPDSALAGLNDWQSIGDQAPGWLQHDSVRIAEYFYVEKEPYELAMLKDGSTVPVEELKGQKPTQVVKRYRRKVKWARINGIESLAKKDWLGKYIPVVPDIADDFDVDGERYLAGAVRIPKDAQRAYNYWITSASERIALAPKAQWMIASGQQEGFTKLWEQANTRRFATLVYKPVKIGDTVLPPPTQISSEPAVQGMVEMIQQADSDLKATFGLQDASLGKMNNPQESGKAVLARQQQGDIAILNYTGNHARFLRAIGKIIVDLMPKIVRSPRMQRIINPDGTTTHVGIYNSEFDTEEEARERLADVAADNAAIKRIYDVGVGDYDISIDSGESYKTKRKEASVAMMAMVDAYPQLMESAADLVIKNMDWPGSQEMADRLRKMIPPQLLPNADDGDPKQQVQTLQSQLQSMMQAHDLLAKELNAATSIIREKKLELDQKREASMLQAQVQLLVAQAKIQGEGALKALDVQLSTIQDFMKGIHQKMFADEQELDQPPVPPTQVNQPEPQKPDLSAGLLPPQPAQPGQ